MNCKKRILLSVLLCVLCIGWMNPLQVYAADATVTFGSNWYDKNAGETFPIGVYIDADGTIGDYYITIKYDNLRMKYVDGADEGDEEEGMLILSGTGDAASIKYWLQFTAIRGGDASLEVEIAEVHLKDSENEMYHITTYGSAPVNISGEDTEGEEEEAGEAEETVSEPQTDSNAVQEEKEEPVRKQKPSIFFNIYIILVLGVIVLVIIVELLIFTARKLIRKDKKKNTRKKRQKTRTEILVIDLNRSNEADDSYLELPDLREEVNAMLWDGDLQQDYGKPVIKVRDVTMEFHLSSSNPSGLKDYLIQTAKRQITYRRLYALYHVSFNVYKGEVVGIIGTNGSGKSTLLKIVSGALKPTGGRVEVDRRKVQLLTLGTGFDMELTAKENVYLNGSIIGYSREFLDAHYDDIVEFAELQDFMEEKVKNFSSGMVSRLGFAIATAGDAAEILILDEVLAVGDEFFRKKSLRRIKEMIHGGSTVLMVSHGMGTILDNCTKCVWIEKGKLQMVGEPKVVCEAYRKMNQEG